MRGKSGIVYEHGINDMPYGWVSKNKRLYNCWFHMIERVYSNKFHEKYPTYIKTTLQLELHYLSYFVEHMHEIKNYELWLNNPNNYSLDKDIKSNGKNKEYSIENCIFVSNSENVKQANRTRDSTQYIGRNPLIGKNDNEIKEIRKKQSEKIKGINHPNLGSLINRYDLNGNYIDTKYQFEYVKMGFSQSNISKCCKFWEMNCNENEWYKKYKSKPLKKTGGYIWKYKNY